MLPEATSVFSVLDVKWKPYLENKAKKFQAQKDCSVLWRHSKLKGKKDYQSSWCNSAANKNTWR